MEVEWSSYRQGLTHGRGLPQTTSREEFGAVLVDADRNGGYVEVLAAGSRYPLLTLAVSGDFGVAHWFVGENDCRLLHGDGDSSLAPWASWK